MVSARVHGFAEITLSPGENPDAEGLRVPVLHHRWAIPRGWDGKGGHSGKGRAQRKHLVGSGREERSEQRNGTGGRQGRKEGVGVEGSGEAAQLRQMCQLWPAAGSGRPPHAPARPRPCSQTTPTPHRDHHAPSSRPHPYRETTPCRRTDHAHSGRPRPTAPPRPRMEITRLLLLAKPIRLDHAPLPLTTPLLAKPRPLRENTWPRPRRKPQPGGAGETGAG